MSKKSSDKRGGPRKFAPLNLWTVVVAPLIVGVALLGINAGFNGIFSNGPSSDLIGLDPVVHNGMADYESASFRGARASRQTDDSKPRVELRLKNEGERRAYITAATLTVHKLIQVPPCGAGGGVLLSGHYEVTLPREAGEGDTVEVPIDRQVPPDGVDRFEFRIGREYSPRHDEGRTFVYQLDVGLRHDGAKEPVNVGRILIAVPATPSVYALGLELPPASRGCTKPALEDFREAAELDGFRSPQLEHLIETAQG